jgi:hypothetical protein
MPDVLYKGYLKDYEGSTLMECLLHRNVDYNEICQLVRKRKKELETMVQGMVDNHLIYKGLDNEVFFLNKMMEEASNSFLSYFIFVKYFFSFY